jgi:monothiol glutaredoxin
MTRRVLAADLATPAANAAIDRYKRDVLDEALAAVDAHDVVIIGMHQNMVVKGAQKLLRERGTPFHVVLHGNYLRLSDYRTRLVFKMYTGWPTFPMVFVKGTFVGGRAELKAAFDDGSFDALLSGPRRKHT